MASLQGDLTLCTRWMDLSRALLFTWLALQLNSQSRCPPVIRGGSLIKHSAKHQFVGRPLLLKQKHKQGSQTAWWKWCKGWVWGMAETNGWSWTRVWLSQNLSSFWVSYMLFLCVSLAHRLWFPCPVSILGAVHLKAKLLLVSTKEKKLKCFQVT